MNCLAQGESLSTYKSMFVYNFIKHIQWPSEAQSIQIGIIGSDDALVTAFEKMAKAKSTPAQQIIIKKITTSELNSCHMIYLATGTPASSLTEISAQLKQKPVVVITDQENLTQKGAFISFKLLENKLKFQINKDAFDRCGLKVSGALVSMAI